VLFCEDLVYFGELEFEIFLLVLGKDVVENSFYLLDAGFRILKPVSLKLVYG
jgi:hypothetical protein